ncbi:MAG: rhomboid family intramembrane serine protease [Archangiaceae bacterium]|nr:rhomboid family intramembrane serine protease [Archangiaceae bacterium]
MSQLQQWLNPRSSAAKMAVLFVIASIAFYLTSRWTAPWVVLVPDAVIHELRLWQLLTYSVIFHKDPLNFIFGVLILISIGGSLERHWGPKRLWLFSFGIAFFSAVLTVLLALVVPGLDAFVGANVIVSSQWVAYGLLIGNGRTNFWGLPVTGNTLALIGAAFVLLSCLLGGWSQLVPEVFSLVLVFLHVRLGLPHDLIQRFGSWRLQRDLSRRSSHLRVISGDERNTPRDSDKYLH